MIIGRRIFLVLAVALLGGVLGWLPASGQQVAPTATGSPPTQVELYAPFVIPVPVNPALYDNPFDADDIEVLGIFRSPSRREMVISGFWMQPYEDVCPQNCAVEDWQPVGDPRWEVRFTPQEIGPWTYTVQVRDDGGVVYAQEGQFVVNASARHGFIRVSGSRRYFQYENGQPYFPIGHNLKWSWQGGGGLRAYEQWLRDLSAAGGNYARLFIDVPWFIGLEWQPPAGDYRAAQAAAARLDSILAAAEQNGIALQLVLLWHQAIRFYDSPPVLLPESPPRPDLTADWDDNPYNVLNGGPLSGPGIFFFDEQAMQLFRRRLRYIVARWGYSPQIFAWEIIDQVDRAANFAPDVASKWLKDIASYLRQIDHQGHLITAGSREFVLQVTANPLLDFTEGQFYQRLPLETVSDQVDGALAVIRRSQRAYDSPTLLVDYSLNPWFEPVADDPEGVHVQNTLWATALSGAAGGAVSGWGDTYIMARGLERYYAPLANFVSGINWPGLDLRPVEAGVVLDDPAAYAPVRITGFNRQFRAAQPEAVVAVITADGLRPDPAFVPAYLYGQVYDQQFKHPHTYTLSAPVDTILAIRVRRAADEGGARLQVTVDDHIAAELELSPGAQDVALRVPLRPGEQTLVLDNIGDNWLELEEIVVERLRTPVRLLTLRDSSAGVALSWLQHRDYTWEQVAVGRQRTPISPRFRLDGMPSGRYLVEIWNPLSGAVLGEELISVADNGVLLVDLLPFDSQVALRIFKQSDLPPSTPTPPITITSTPSPTSTPTSTATAAATVTSTPTLAPLLLATNTPRPTHTPTPGS